MRKSTSRNNASEAPPPAASLPFPPLHHNTFLPPERLQTLPLSVAATCSLLLLACSQSPCTRCRIRCFDVICHAPIFRITKHGRDGGIKMGAQQRQHWSSHLSLLVIVTRYESEKVWPRPSCGVYVAVMLVRVLIRLGNLLLEFCWDPCSLKSPPPKIPVMSTFPQSAFPLFHPPVKCPT
jgi:hypothetical protein